MDTVLRYGTIKRGILCAMGTLFTCLVFFTGPASAVNGITQYGITWTFDRDITTDGADGTYRYGTFVNGDYWIVGPVNVVAIDPACGTLNGRVSNGSQVNPTNDWAQGYDEDAPWYDETLNAGIGISASSPLRLSAHSSLVSSKGLTEPTHYTRVSDAAVLTVLPEAPPADAFRPPYCGDDKTIRFTEPDLDYGVLKNLTGYGAPDIADCEKDFERPRIDHGPIPHGQLIRPHNNYNGSPYGRELARASTNAALVLNLDYTDAEKELLLIRYVQYGIDLFGIICTEGEGWHGDGGHSGGRKLPILFAGTVLGDEDMLGIGEYSGQYLHTDPYGPGDRPPGYKDFGEDAQTFYVSELEVEITHTPDWWITHDGDEAIAYETPDIGLPEWTQTHSHAPQKCTNWWDAAYREVAGCTFPGAALTAHLMGFTSAWNNPAFFDYCDRYMTNISVNPAYTGWQTGTNGVGYFTVMLWRTYRNDYGCQWVPYDSTDLYSRGGSDCSRCVYHCSGAAVTGNKAAAPARKPAVLAYPSPMKDHVAISVGTVHEPFSRITIYDGAGTTVYQTTDSRSVLRWNGTSMSGKPVPPGMYWYNIHSDGQEFSGRIMKIQ